MAINNITLLRKRHESEHREGSTIYQTRAYQAGAEASLATMNLTVGENFPDDSNFEIVKSVLQYDKQADMRYAQVTGLKEIVADSTASPWGELVQSRRIITTNPTKRWEMTFTGSTTAKEPERQQTYRDITGITEILRETGMINEPEIINILEVKQATRNKTHVTVLFEGLWALVR